MKCKKCGNDLYNIKIMPTCDDCPNNGAMDDDTGKYTTDETVIKKKCLERTQDVDCGECSMGSAMGDGCYLFTCVKCKFKTHSCMIAT